VSLVEIFEDRLSEARLLQILVTTEIRELLPIIQQIYNSAQLSFLPTFLRDIFRSVDKASATLVYDSMCQ
jgi:hypothetical protein